MSEITWEKQFQIARYIGPNFVCSSSDKLDYFAERCAEEYKKEQDNREVPMRDMIEELKMIVQHLNDMR